MTPFHLPCKGLTVVSGPRPGCSTTVMAGRGGGGSGHCGQENCGTNEAWPASVQYELGPTERADG